MIAHIEEKVNSRQVTNSLFPGSMDANALFPSLIGGPTADIVCEMVKESDLTTEGVDWGEAGKYLRINMSPEEIARKGLADLCSSRASSKGACPGMTTGEVLGKLYPEPGEQTSKFLPPKRQPRDKSEKQKVLAEVLRIGILAILAHHRYLGT